MERKDLARLVLLVVIVAKMHEDISCLVCEVDIYVSLDVLELTFGITARLLGNRRERLTLVVGFGFNHADGTLVDEDHVVG